MRMTMKITVATSSWEEVDLIEALSTPLIAWDYEIITGVYAETYYPAEIDDIFLEINQEILNSYDGSIDQHRLVWLECSDLDLDSQYMSEVEKYEVVLLYLKDNIHRVIDVDQIGGDW